MKKELKIFLIIFPCILLLIPYGILQCEWNHGRYSDYLNSGFSIEDIKIIKEELYITNNKVDTTIETFDKTYTDSNYLSLPETKYDKTHHSLIVFFKDSINSIRNKNNDNFQDIIQIQGSRILTYDEYKEFCKDIFIEKIYSKRNLSYLVLFPKLEYNPDILDCNLLDITYNKELNEITAYVEYIYGEIPDSFQNNDFIKIIPIDSKFNLNDNTTIKIVNKDNFEESGRCES